MDKLEIKVGDKVIRKDGLCGRITHEPTENLCAMAQYENGLIEAVKDANNYENYYLIGKTVLGNKIDEETLQRKLDKQYDKTKQEQAKYDQLRKQLWYLKNRMVDEP